MSQVERRQVLKGATVLGAGVAAAPLLAACGGGGSGGAAENTPTDGGAPSGSSGGDDTPTESLSFAFAKVAIAYFKQGTDKGTLVAGNSASWDLTTVSKD